MTTRQDDVELINRSLRDGGHPVHCHWVTSADALAEAIESYEPELLWYFADTLPTPVRDVVKIKQQSASIAPLLVVRQTVEEADITDAMLAGAQDLVSPGEIGRLRSVAERELRAFRLERALNETLQTASEYKRELKALMADSVDAIAHVQEGILIEANQAWAELFGHESPETMTGPLMDAFASSSHAALKGALAACAKGQWQSDTLKVAAQLPDGSTLPLTLRVEATTLDGEPAVKLSVEREQVSPSSSVEILELISDKDPSTGFFHRRRFLELLTDRLDAKLENGVRALAYLRPDRFGDVENQIGPIASEDVLVQLAELLGELVEPRDLCGRFGGTVFAVLLERDNVNAVQEWAERARDKIAEKIFSTAHNTLSLTCTIGLAEVGPTTDRMESLLVAARRANAIGRSQGGNRVVLEETSDESTRVQRFDEVWVQQIKSALMENRFRLAHLPIASLTAPPRVMFDTVLRMVDQQGDEVPASDFLPAASRNRLMRAIDRWVIGASLSHCAKNALDCLFVKLSAESLIDKSLMEWLAKAVESSGVAPSKLCFAVSEDDATQYLAQTQALAEILQKRGHLFAIEHFGIGRDSMRVLTQTPMQYLKIDGSLMPKLATDRALQDKVGTLIATAAKRNIATIAERVEDANTMAVLFQLGAGYMQGYYVHEPEVVLAEHG